MPRRPPTLRHRAVIGRRRLAGEIRHLRAAEQLLVRTLRALSVEGAALRALVDAELSGAAAPASATAVSTVRAGAPLPPSMVGVGDVLASNDERALGSAPAEAVEAEIVASALASVGAGLMAAGGLTSADSASGSVSVLSARTVEHSGVGHVRNAFGLDEDEDDFDF